ncbi:MAG: tRNA 2-thiouridine(34) synthase MnmA, partial [Deltaproteobacteria bacterium]|nr:tRNA 2-thiouridine(34) synthase MnmA [Deltaproteobacteria bacterium]
PAQSTSASDLHSPVHKLAEQIGIPLEVIDLSEAFEKEVVLYFINAYRSGQTPNPCMVCNERIKFGRLLHRAEALGASHLATGHYAGIQAEADGHFSLLKGVDPIKDQSYFLSRLSQNELKKTLFPLGAFTKNQVREMARTWQFESIHGRESQELCFVEDDNYKRFLSQWGGLPSKPGPIVTTDGRAMGHHHGLHNYTVGQRRGINIPGPVPYYVIRLDHVHNRLVIGLKSELAAKECLVTHINWIEGESPEKPISVSTRIRYRHKEAESTLTPVDGHTAKICFSRPQDAITPGQGAVFYQGERVLGGGWIAP